MSQPPSTLVCFAVKEELKPFAQLVAQRPHIRTQLTGMGWRNAEQAIRTALDQERPGLVLSCGFAGGLNPELPTGTVLFAADQQSGLEQALLAAGARPARFHCLDRVATTAQEKLALFQTTGADAVEMESQVIREVCGKQKIPSAVVRVVLDAAQDDLPLDFNRLMTPEREMSPSKLAGAILSSPATIGRLLAFRKQVVAAAQALGVVLAQALDVSRG
jgi:adenosylhomocysteine nucleosidase